jgi:hypothetical protein
MNRGSTYAFSYKSYNIHWTGWKASIDCDVIVGQWLGHPKGGRDSGKPYFYSSFPGRSGKYTVGERFDLTPDPSFDKYKTRNECKLAALERLQRLIDEEENKG